MSERNPFEILSTRPVYENPWIAVREHRIEKPRGGEGIYGIVHFKHRAVGVIAYEAGEVWLVGQYRLPLGAYSWEIPEGGAPFDEDPEVCARRELEEETGIVAGRLEKLFSMHLSNSVSDELAIVFLATELRPGVFAPEDTEELALKKVPLSELYRMVESGQITDSITVAATYRLMLRERDAATSGAKREAMQESVGFPPAI